MPTALQGRTVQLEPLQLSHASALLEISSDPGIWTYLLVPQPTSVEEMRSWIESAVEEGRKGAHLPFAVFLLADGRLVGTTRFLDIKPFEKSLEIGWTFYSPEAQRTAVNTECKYLLLKHAFEELGCQRVQLKTDALNERSRRAIERIGGRFEGILRNFQRYWHGQIRDTAMYSIIDKEWPEVKSKLEAMMSR